MKKKIKKKYQWPTAFRIYYGNYVYAVISYISLKKIVAKYWFFLQKKKKRREERYRREESVLGLLFLLQSKDRHRYQLLLRTHSIQSWLYHRFHRHHWTQRPANLSKFYLFMRGGGRRSGGEKTKKAKKSKKKIRRTVTVKKPFKLGSPRFFFFENSAHNPCTTFAVPETKHGFYCNRFFFIIIFFLIQTCSVRL